MGSPIEIKTPTKGVVKTTNFQDFPPDSCIDALNVLPWDRTGRLRVNQRSGTDKLWPAAMGNGSQALQCMIQTTLALDPATIVPSSNIIDDAFPYAAGALQTMSSNWVNRHQSVGGSGALLTGINGATNTTLITGSGTVTTTYVSGQNIQGDAGMWKPSVTLGASYIVRGVFNMPTNNSGIQCGVFARTDSSTTNATNQVAFVLTAGLTTAYLMHGDDQTIANTNLVSHLTIPLLSSGTHQVDLRVSGNVFSAWIDNINYGQFTWTNGVSMTGTGFTFTTLQSSLYLQRFQVWVGVTPASLRQTNVLSVCGGSIYMGQAVSGSPSNALVSGGANVLTASGLVSGCFSQGLAYFVDGFTIYQVNLTSQVASPMVATAGTLPANCTLSTVWRDRLVLAAPHGTPQNFFMSRVGVATDFDYSQQDSAAAFAGNASTAGHIGEPIVSLIPFTDDVLFIMGDHNVWVVRGDPADGGSIDLISDAIGILGQNAWCKAPDGTVYFAGTGGLYRIAPGSTVCENISNSAWNEFFRTINRGSQYVTLAWDRDQQGMYIFVENVNASGTGGTNLWYDFRTGGLWPLRYPDNHGPVVALVYDGDGPTDRVLLLGGRDGFVRRVQLTDMDDDGTAIASYIYLGPFKTDDTSETLLEWTDVVMGEPPPGFAATNWSCVVTIQSHSTVEKAFVSPLYSRSRTTVPRRQVRWLARQRGGAFFFKLANNAPVTNGATWSFEKITALMTPAGTVRRR
jgi:hypothetical protein